MSYFCTECKRKHHSGKLFKKHKQFEKVKEEEIPFDKILDFNYDLLPPIAQRQILIYARKMVFDKKHNWSKQREMYTQQINKIILHYDTEIPIIL